MHLQDHRGCQKILEKGMRIELWHHGNQAVSFWSLVVIDEKGAKLSFSDSDNSPATWCGDKFSLPDNLPEAEAKNFFEMIVELVACTHAFEYYMDKSVDCNYCTAVAEFY